MVIGRGRLANEPMVVSIVARDGMPLGVPGVRDTRSDVFATAGGIAFHEVKVLIKPLQMLKMR